MSSVKLIRLTVVAMVLWLNHTVSSEAPPSKQKCNLVSALPVRHDSDAPMELFERFAAGEMDAFEAVFREWQGQVFGWIVRMVRDQAVAEDLTMETFWRIYCARHRFDPARPFGAWARRIATNATIDYLKSRRVEDALPVHVATQKQGDPAWDRQVREGVEGALRSLPAKLQVAATLALIEERPYDEIASALGTSVSAIKTRVFRAVRMLRKKLDKLGIRP
jgi:RNA polymerase sigma-70 factor, ECF subfamily